jgi:hypothetical protein
VVTLAAGVVTGCIAQTDSACTTVVALAEEGAALGVAVAESCGGAVTSQNCDQVVTLTTSVASLVQGVAYSCLNGLDATCYLVGSTADNAVYNAGLTAAGCVANASTTCGAAASSADVLVSDVVHTIVDGTICGLDSDVCTILTEDVGGQTVETPTGYDFADNSPTDVDAWDFTPPPDTGISIDDTVTGTDQTALDTAGGLTAHPADQCTPSWEYDVDKSYGAHKAFRFGSYVNSLDNDSDARPTLSIEQDVDKKLAVTLSVSAEVQEGVIFAHVKETFGLSVTGEVEYEDKVGYSVSVSPHKLGHLGQGVIGYKTRGHYYHINGACMVDIDKGYPIAWTPSYQAPGYTEEPAAPVDKS